MKIPLKDQEKEILLGIPHNIVWEQDIVNKYQEIEGLFEKELK